MKTVFLHILPSTKTTQGHVSKEPVMHAQQRLNDLTRGTAAQFVAKVLCNDCYNEAKPEFARKYRGASYRQLSITCPPVIKVMG